MRDDSPDFRVVGVLALIMSLMTFGVISTLPKHDKLTSVYAIRCELGGVTVLEGYTNRNGVIRQEYLDKDTLRAESYMILPGTKCEMGKHLYQSEWDKIQRETTLTKS